MFNFKCVDLCQGSDCPQVSFVAASHHFIPDAASNIVIDSFRAEIVQFQFYIAKLCLMFFKIIW